MVEKPAKGVTGFVLYSPVTKGYFFRVYDPVDKSKFTDYRLAADDIEVTVEDRFTVLYEDPDDPEKNKLDYSRRVLGTDKPKS